MNNRCPSCERDLAETKPVFAPLKGQLKWLPLRGALACPGCGAHVQMNLHPIERKVRGVDALLLLLFVALSVALDDSRYFFLGVGGSGVAELTLWAWSRKNLREWRRYAVMG